MCKAPRQALEVPGDGYIDHPPTPAEDNNTVSLQSCFTLVLLEHAAGCALPNQATLGSCIALALRASAMASVSRTDSDRRSRHSFLS